MTFYENALRIIKDEVEKCGSVYAFAKQHGVHANKISFWLKGKTKPNLSDIGMLFDEIGYGIVRRESVNEVQFVTECGPDFEGRWVSIPVIDHPDNLPQHGFIPDVHRAGSSIVDAEFASVQGMTSLVVVRIEDDRMAPTLKAGSLVLVNRATRKPDTIGDLWLTRFPDGTGTAVRRVTIEPDADDIRIVFSCDNHHLESVHLFSLNRDYGGCLDTAILGRATWQRRRLY